MDDDRLASELERRSRLATPRPDWAQRDLLSAVRHEIDARPQRVQAARWSPLAGLATLVVAVLVVAVAAPRLLPAPPTSTSLPSGSAQPTPPLTQPLVMLWDEFAARLAMGQLDGETVVVDGTIGERPESAGIDCHVPIGQTCLMGRLEDTDVDVVSRWITTDEVDPSVGPSDVIWPWAHLPSGPVTGFLVLKVDGQGEVEFLGLARDFGPSLAWSVTDADAQHLDINTLEPNEVILVRGWLVETEEPGSVTEIICDGFATPRPNLPGLPSRYCQPTDFLTDEPPGDRDMRSSNGKVRVQRDAARLFGGPTPDEAGLFAIAPRLYGGGCAEEPPCWFWDVIARVDALPEPMLPTPSPSPSPISGGPIQCPWLGWVNAEGTPIPVSPVPPPPEFVDLTGLVTECVSSDRPMDSFPRPVIDAVSDTGMHYHFNWTASECDTISTVTLERVGERYRVTIDQLQLTTLQGGVPPRECDNVSRRQVRIELSQSIDSSLIDLVREPAQVDPTSIACPAAAGSAPGGAISIEDHAGLIDSCSARLVDWPGVPITVSDAARGVVEVVVEDGCAGASDVRLDLWARGSDALPWQRPYVLAPELRRPDAPLGCRDAMAGIAVEITFMNAALAPMSLAADVEAFLSVDGRGTAVAEAGDGAYRFNLEISASKPVYASGEAIEVSAALTSEMDLTVSCPSGPHLGLEQLDGTLRSSPGATILMCSAPWEMQAGEPVVRQFVPGRSPNTDPDPVAQYMREGKLYLPPGTYLFGARATFQVGQGPGGERLQLDASVVIHVEGGSAPAPSPTPWPSAIQCAGDGVSTSIVDPGDLVLSCTHISPNEVPDVGPGEITVSNTVGDPARVRIRWTTSLCTNVAWLRRMGTADHVFFELSPSASCMLKGAKVVAIELVLSKPADVNVARVIPV